MIGKFFWIIALLTILAGCAFGRPGPDSAGIAPRPNGLAYGGIPYGSISGQLSLYYGEYEPIIYGSKASVNEVQIL